MWICPKCGREFKKTNQGHYCGKAPETIEEYIAAQIQEAQTHMIELRQIMQRCAPDAVERIAWSMPVYKKDNCSISFAACKKHISFYADMDILEIYKSQLTEYTIKKNAIYLPYDKVLPIKVLEDIVRLSFTRE